MRFRNRETLLTLSGVFAAILAVMVALGLFMDWEKAASERKPVPVDVAE